MRPKDFPDSSTSPRPRIPGGGILDVPSSPSLISSGSSSAAASAADAVTSSTVFAPEVAAVDDDEDTLMVFADDEDDEDDDEEDEDLDDDESSFYAQLHHYQPISHHSTQLYFNQNPYSQLSSAQSGANPYPLEVSPEDGPMFDLGVPMVNPINTHQTFSHHFDMDTSAESSGEFDLGDEAEQEFDDTGSVLAEAFFAGSPPLMPQGAPVAAPGPPPPLNPLAITTHLEQLMTADVAEAAQAEWFNEHPVAMTNANPGMLGPANYGLTDFLHSWAADARSQNQLSRAERARFPWPEKINEQATTPLTHVQYADLEGDVCDFQGIDWEHLGVSRKEARERRLLMYHNYVHRSGGDRWDPSLPDRILPPTENVFRFRRMDIRHNTCLSHFQLRNILASNGRNQAFYPGPVSAGVQAFHMGSGECSTIMKLQETSSLFSTLSADSSVLVGGAFGGEYMINNLRSDHAHGEGTVEGLITNHSSGITNHVQVYQARSSGAPLAAFASNDMGFRVLDLTTQTWLSETSFDIALNCTALSPDGRMRVMVGDSYNFYVALAEDQHQTTILHEMSGHRDWGFACAWADDGWTVATGFQDKAVKIWDARKWNDSQGMPNPVCTIRSVMAGVRGLRFSPVGSGPRVLVAAEEADFVHVIDARTFGASQRFDMFGEIGGVDFADEGRDLLVLNCDRTRGGIVQLERCGRGAGATVRLEDVRGRVDEDGWPVERGMDWPASVFTEKRRVKESRTRRARRAAGLDAIEPF